MKFGGTSLIDAAAIRRAIALVEARRPERPLVVVSATAGTTNALLDAVDRASAGRLDQARSCVRRLRERHVRILAELRLSPALRGWTMDSMERSLDELGTRLRRISVRGKASARSTDAALGDGERLAALLFHAATLSRGVASLYVDARGLVVTDRRFGRARPLPDETRTRVCSELLPILENGSIVVTEGFIGATTGGQPTTLGRGGSDLTASLLGWALEASEIQIWTDVPGMLTAEPRLVADGRPIPELSFDEAAELAYFGAKVLHPATIAPARASGIPVRILDSRRAHEPGTRIAAVEGRKGLAVKSIACKRRVAVVHLSAVHGGLRGIFERLDRLELEVGVMTVAASAVALTVDDLGALDAIEAELSQVAEVRVVKRQAIVSLVGESFGQTPGIAARVFAALGSIHVRLVSHGASERSLSFIVDDDDVEEAVRRVHRELFSFTVEDEMAFVDASEAVG